MAEMARLLFVIKQLAFLGIIPYFVSGVVHQCGRPAIEPSVLSDKRILGGESAISGSWPWQARIGERVAGGISFFCGGAVLNPLYIVTAGHCFPGSNLVARKYVVRVAEYNMSASESIERDYNVVMIVKHPNYTAVGAPANDVTVLRLTYPIIFTDHISNICLPIAGNDPEPGSQCVVTGWGRYVDQFETDNVTVTSDNQNATALHNTTADNASSSTSESTLVTTGSTFSTIDDTTDQETTTSTLDPESTSSTSTMKTSKSSQNPSAAPNSSVATVKTSHSATRPPQLTKTSTKKHLTTKKTTSKPTTHHTSTRNGRSTPQLLADRNNSQIYSHIPVQHLTTKKVTVKPTTKHTSTRNGRSTPQLLADRNNSQIYSQIPVHHRTTTTLKPHSKNTRRIAPTTHRTTHRTTHSHPTTKKPQKRTPPFLTSHSEVLQQAVIPILERSKCNEYWKPLLRETMICTFPAKGDPRKEPCKGDSGGPLVCKSGSGPDAVWRLEGIISFGAGCGGARPAVYTRVANYVHWIEKVAKYPNPVPLSALMSLSANYRPAPSYFSFPLDFSNIHLQ